MRSGSRYVIDDDARCYLAVLGLADRARPLDPLADPIVNYMGSKDAGGAVERIIGTFPPHSVYVEPFLGGGAVLRRKRPALASIGIDADGDVVDRWRATGFPAEFVHGDALAWLDEHGRTLPRDALIYCDPPYLHETRSSRRRYRCELSDEQHRELLGILRGLSCSIVISGYDHPIYRELLADWEHESFQAMTRGGVRLEHLWIWRGGPTAGFGEAARYAGRNFRERERIKRKAARWRANFLAMPAAERDAVLRALLVGTDDDAGDLAAGGDADVPTTTRGDARSTLAGPDAGDRPLSPLPTMEALCPC